MFSSFSNCHSLSLFGQNLANRFSCQLHHNLSFRNHFWKWFSCFCCECCEPSNLGKDHIVSLSWRGVQCLHASRRKVHRCTFLWGCKPCSRCLKVRSIHDILSKKMLKNRFKNLPRITSGALYYLVFIMDCYCSFLYVAPPKSIILTVSSRGLTQTCYLNRRLLDLMASAESYGIKPMSDSPPMLPPVHPSIYVSGFSFENLGWSNSSESLSSTFSPSYISLFLLTWIGHYDESKIYFLLSSLSKIFSGFKSVCVRPIFSCIN